MENTNQEKQIKEVLRNSVSPFLIGLRNELKQTNSLVASLLEASQKEFENFNLADLKGDAGYTPRSGIDYFTVKEKYDFLTKATPVKGVDYFTDKEVKEIIKASTPKRGVDYFTPSDVKYLIKQSTPKKGVHYLTEKEIERMLKKITPKKGKDYADGKDGVTKTVIVKDETKIPAEKVRDLLESLKGTSRLSMKAIKGLDETIRRLEVAIANKSGGSSIGGTGGGTSTGAVWGGLTGTLSDQLDLQSALNAKATIGIGVSNFSNDAGYLTSVPSGIDATKIADGSISNTEFQYLNGVSSNLQTQLNAKQATLVSATNIKTINGSSLLGSGDLTVSGSVAIGSAITSATAGSVLFAGASGVLQQDNANFFWDDTNNRLGIGKNNPSYALDVVSAGNVEMWIGSQGSSFGYTLGRNTSNGFLEIFGNQGIFSGISVDQIRSAGAITIGGNAVISNWASTLGLGSGSGTPSAVLEIRNGAQSMLIGGGTGYGYLFQRNSSTGFFEITGQQSGYTGYIIGTANGANALTINDGGSVGMGVAIGSIGAKLHIIKTSEQLRIGYDASNRMSLTVGSTGGVTFDAVGSGAGFTFSDPVTVNGLFTLSAQNIATDTTTGMKIGTSTTQKIGFYNTTPIVQGASVADATGGVVVDAEARTAINSLISRIEAVGLIATV